MPGIGKDAVPQEYRLANTSDGQYDNCYNQGSPENSTRNLFHRNGEFEWKKRGGCYYDRMQNTILFVGGGSVGHIAPSVAVWRALQSSHPEWGAHFVCADREDDRKFLEKESLEYTSTHAPRLSLTFPLQFWKAYKEAKAILDQVQPAAVFSKGGYVSVPLCFAAHRSGIPIVLHESDAVGGRANQLVARWATTVCKGFEIGNPIRPEMTQGSREEGLRLTGFAGQRPILLVTGGSQGAESINQIICTLLPKILEHMDVIHICGRGKTRAEVQEGYWAREFAQQELAHFYAVADIAVSRAGASNITELAGNGIPSIIVPLRGVGHDHQQKNAEAVERQGGCILLQQTVLEEQLIDTVSMLLQQPSTVENLSEGIQSFYNPNAAESIAREIEKILAHSVKSP